MKNRLELDDEMLLVEAIYHSTHPGDTSNTGIGDRVVASGERINGVVYLEKLLLQMRDAFRAGGWNGSGSLHFRNEDSQHSVSGREWALRGAIANVVIYANVDSPSPENTYIALSKLRLPEGSIKVTANGAKLEVEIQYLSSGVASNAINELDKILTDNGFVSGPENSLGLAGS